MVINTSNFIHENLAKGLDSSALSSALSQTRVNLDAKFTIFHVIERGEHKLLRVNFEKNSDRLKINILDYLNFEGVQKTYEGCPSSMQAFIEYLNKRQLLILNKNEQPQITPPSSPKPKKAPVLWINSNDVTVKLSREIREGMIGNRGPDHQIPESVLRVCIEKKSKRLKNEINNHARLDFYFNVINDTSSQILNLVLSPDPSQNAWHAITAYYMPTSSIKARFNFTDTKLEAWKKNLPSLRPF